MIVSDEQLLHAKRATEHAGDEFLCGVSRERLSKWNYSEVLETRFGEHFEFLLARGEEEWRRGRIDDLHRMRIESHKHAGNAARRRSGDELLDDVAVSTVNAVECADGDDG